MTHIEEHLRFRRFAHNNGERNILVRGISSTRSLILEGLFVLMVVGSACAFLWRAM